MFVLFLCLWMDSTYPIETLNRSAGLESSVIHCLLKDQKGFLWIGTQKGLYRYDGHRFQSFFHQPDQLDSLPDNDIRDLLEGPDGRLLIATEAGGLAILNAQTYEIQRLDLADSAGIPKIFDLHLFQDSLWLATNHGLMTIKPDQLDQPKVPIQAQTSEVFVYRLGHSEEHLLAGCYGGFFFGTLADGLKRFDVGSPANLVTGFYPLPSGEILILGFEGVFRFEPKTGRIRTQPTQPDLRFLTAVVGDASNYLWLGSKTTLYQMSLSDFSVQTPLFADLSVIEQTYVVSLLADGSGLLWVGTAGKGLHKINTHPKPFKTLNMNCGLQGNLVFDCVQDENDALWVRSIDGGLDLVDENDQITPVSKDIFTCMTAGPRGVVAADERGGIQCFSFENGSFRKRIPISTKWAIQSLFWEDPDILWVGPIDGGLWRGSLSNQQFEDRTSPDLQEKQVRVLFRDSRDCLWIGTSDGVFTQQSTGPITTLELGKVTYVNAILEDPQGWIWIATYGKGLVRIGPNGHHFFGEVQGIDPGIYGLARDRAGLLWLSSDSGLFRFDPMTQAVVQFTQKDGLAQDEFNSGAASPLKNGRLAFGGISGLTLFSPADMAPSLTPAHTVISAIHIWQEKQHREILMPVSGSPLILNQSPQNLVFEFSSLDLTIPERNQYQYRLLGVDEKWLYTDGRAAQAIFPYLKPGKYTFEVKGTNGDGLWDSQTQTLQLRIKAPFWNRLGIKIMLILLGQSALLWATFAWTKRTVRFPTKPLFARARSWFRPKNDGPEAWLPAPRVGVFNRDKAPQMVSALQNAGFFCITQPTEHKNGGPQINVLFVDSKTQSVETPKDLGQTKNDSALIVVDLLGTWDPEQARVHGATDFIQAPFEVTSLIACLESNFRRMALQTPDPSSERSLSDNQFVERLDQILSQHLAEESFNVYELAEQLGMSRRQLLRKCQQLTGLGPADYLKRTRMYKALALLKKGEGNVSEIAFRVGFKDPKHFSKSFRKFFGMPPSEAKHQL